jgi:YD repeat-containing protein
VKLTVQRVRDLIDGCGFATPADLNTDAPGRLAAHLKRRVGLPRKAGGISHQTAHFIDPRGMRSEFAYDVYGRKVRETDAVNFAAFPGVGLGGGAGSPVHPPPVTKWDYDAADRLVRVVNADGFATQFGYDVHDNKTTTVEAVSTPSQRTTTAVYDAAGNMTSQTTGLATDPTYQHKTTTAFTYDALGRQTKVQLEADLPDDSKGNYSTDSRPWTQTMYDAAGNVIEVLANATTPLVPQKRVSVTKTIYDDLFRPIRTVSGILQRPNGTDDSQRRETYTHYDSVGNVIRVWDARTAVSEFTYDLLGRKTAVATGPANLLDPVTKDWVLNPADSAQFSITVNGYDVFGDVISQQTPIGSTVSVYDRLGRLKTTTSVPDKQHRTEYRYDTVGNRVQVIDKVWPTWYRGKVDGEPLAYASKIEGPDLGNNYPNSGIVITKYTSTAYDLLGRVVSVKDTNGQPTDYRYDALGQVTVVIDRNRLQRSFEYDALGRVRSENWYQAWPAIAPGGVGPQFTNPTYKGGDEYRYDAADDQTATWQNRLDGNGKWVAAYEYDRGYDPIGRMTTELTPWGGFRLDYTYDAAGHVVTVTDNKGGSLSSRYDAAGRLVSRGLSVGSVGEAFRFDYQPGKRGVLDRVRTTDVVATAGVSESAVAQVWRDYDGAGRVRLVMTASRQGGTSALRVVQQFTYTYNASRGLVETESRAAVDPVPLDKVATNYLARYDYDGRGQVTLASRTGSAPQSYQFDAGGMPPYGDPSRSNQENKTAAVATPDNRVSRYSVGSQRWTSIFDAEGNVTLDAQQVSDTSGQQAGNLLVGRKKSSYDFRNQLVGVDVGRGRQGAAPNDFLPDLRLNYDYDSGGRLIQRFSTTADGTSQDVLRYVYVGDQIYAILDGNNQVVDRYVRDDDGTLLGRVDAGGNRLVYATDRLGSVAATYLVGSGALQTPSVQEESFDGLSVRAVRGPLDRFGPQGRLVDPATRLQWDGSRWVNPDAKRFVTENGVARPSGNTNLYTYAGNSWPNGEDRPQAAAGPGFWDFSGGFWDWTARRSDNAADIATGVGGAIGKLPGQLYDLAGDTLRAGRGLGNIAGRGLGLTNDIYVPDIRSDMVRSYDEAVKRGEGGAAWRRAVGGALTLNLSEVAIAGAAWYNGEGDGKQFGEALGGALVALAGGRLALRGGAAVGRGGASLYNAAGKATLGSVARFVGTQALGGLADIGLTPLWRAAGPALRLGGLATGASVRTLFRTGNAGEQTNALSRMAHPLSEPTTAAGRLKAWAARQVAEWTGTKACFVAGTPLEGQFGAKAIEQFKSYEECGDDCDLIVSRCEHDPDGVLVLRRVLRRFERTAPVFNLHAGGRVIGTTGEHPFYARGRGWTAARELRIGDEVRLMGAGWLSVEGVADSGRVEAVYNLEVEDDHTYFVGSAEWGFAVWAHNARCTPEEAARMLNESAVNDALKSNTRRAEAGVALDHIRTGNLEGHLLDTLVAENQAVHGSVQRLVQQLGPDVLIAQERGGRLMTEVAVGGLPEMASRVMVIEKAFAKSADHIVPQLVESVGQGNRNFVIIETHMGGGNLGNIKNIAAEFLTHPEVAGKGVSMNAIMLRETFGFEHAVAREGAILRGSGVAGLETYRFPTRVILGEDVGSIANAGISTRPLVIFDGSGNVVRTITPGTAGAGPSTRSAFVALMNGKI